MKKFVLTTLAILLSTVMYAQSCFNIKAGVQGSKFSFSDSESRMTIRGGIGGLLQLGESSFYFMPQLLYAQKGQESGGFLNDCTIHYAEVPIQIGAIIKFSKRTGLGLSVGPYAAVGVAGKTDNPQVSDIFDAVSRFDAGISAGVQLYLWRVMIFADYDYGLRDIMNKDYMDIGEKLTTRSGSVGIGLTF